MMERSGMTPQQLDALNRQIQGLQASLAEEA
jgi:hypothetical protein